MPTVLSIFGLRVVIYPNDHRPAHVHVMGKGCEAVFNLHCPAGRRNCARTMAFRPGTLGKIIDALVAHLAALCRDWRGIHGNY